MLQNKIITKDDLQNTYSVQNILTLYYLHTKTQTSSKKTSAWKQCMNSTMEKSFITRSGKKLQWLINVEISIKKNKLKDAIKHCFPNTCIISSLKVLILPK